MEPSERLKALLKLREANRKLDEALSESLKKVERRLVELHPIRGRVFKATQLFKKLNTWGAHDPSFRTRSSVLHDKV